LKVAFLLDIRLLNRVHIPLELGNLLGVRSVAMD
jgi:hypothetical protein